MKGMVKFPHPHPAVEGVEIEEGKVKISGEVEEWEFVFVRGGSDYPEPDGVVRLPELREALKRLEKRMEKEKLVGVYVGRKRITLCKGAKRRRERCKCYAVGDVTAEAERGFDLFPLWVLKWMTALTGDEGECFIALKRGLHLWSPGAWHLHVTKPWDFSPEAREEFIMELDGYW